MTPADIAMAYVSPGFLEEDLATGYTLDREPTPPHVADLLDVAYEGRQAWIGVPLASTPSEETRANRSGTTLTYGEVHQDGLTKLLGPRGLDIEGRGSKCLLELGSGRGRLALQAFLQYPGLRTVVAVELVSARHRAAAIATKRLRDAGGEGRFALFAALPDDDAARIGEKRLHSESVYSGEAASVRLSEGAGPEARRCDLRLGDLAALPSDDLALADAVLLEVVMPPGPGRAEAHMQLCRKLAEHCRHGCVLASYEDVLATVGSILSVLAVGASILVLCWTILAILVAMLRPWAQMRHLAHFINCSSARVDMPLHGASQVIASTASAVIGSFRLV